LILDKEKQDRLNKLKSLCQNDLKFLCKNILDMKDWQDGLHDELAEFLMREHSRKLILIPRNHLKTSICTVGFAILSILKNPDIRILITNATLRRTEEIMSQIQGYLKDSVLPGIFGEFENKSTRWTIDQITIAQRKSKAIKEPTISIASITTNVTGGHYDLIIHDDLVERGNIGTAEQMQKVKDFFTDSLNLAPNSPIVTIGTRWAMDDLYGDLLGMKDFANFVRAAVDDGGNVIFPNMVCKDRSDKDWQKKICLEAQLELQGTYSFHCTPKESPVLMGDFTYKPISEVKVGDEVIGWKVSKTGRRQVVKSLVLANGKRKSVVQTMEMESGRKVRCTPDHRWYTGRLDKTHKEYSPAKIGSKLMFVADPKDAVCPSEMLWGASWLGGMFDGVVGIKEDGIEDVYSMQTETGNYVVWGYASKNCQYMNNPTSEDTIEFKRPWITTFDMNSDLFNELKGIEGLLSVDPAFRLKQTSDYSGLVVTKTTEDNMTYVLEAEQKKMNAKELIHRIFQHVETYNVKKAVIESQAAQIVLIQLLKEEMRKRGKFFVVEEVTQDTKETKAMRIRALIPHYANGRILHRRGLAILEDQLVQFPRSMHDDVLDALSMQSKYWRTPRGRLVNKSHVQHWSWDWWKKQVPDPRTSAEKKFSAVTRRNWI